MSQIHSSASRITRRVEPDWDSVQPTIPNQGAWSEDEYLALATNRRLEFSDGRIEVLPMPVMSHESIVKFLYTLLLAFATSQRVGEVYFAGIRVRLWRGKYRVPDVVFMRTEHADRMGEACWDGADLLMEVVSGNAEDRRRDLVTKRREYAKARIPEYWIVDPKKETITVLRLHGMRYLVHGSFAKGETATSYLLHGFAVNVNEVFSQQRGKPATRAKKPRKRSR
jgi:Uma2 family endonuclease